MFKLHILRPFLLRCQKDFSLFEIVSVTLDVRRPTQRKQITSLLFNSDVLTHAQFKKDLHITFFLFVLR